MIRALLIALPIGLGFMVPLSLWIYYQKKHAPPVATSQYAAMLRRELDAQDFARYARILSQDLGERSLAKPENLDAAASFVESTMGYDNMGYAVQRQSFDLQGKPAANLVAELTGKTKPNEVVLAVANYDDADALGIAALMCVAHAFAGTEHSRTIRFAAVMSEAGGFEKLRAKMASEGKILQTLIRVTSASQPPADDKGLAEKLSTFQVTKLDDATASVARLRELQRLIEQSADPR